jgi:hypothetical protein
MDKARAVAWMSENIHPPIRRTHFGALHINHEDLPQNEIIEKNGIRTPSFEASPRGRIQMTSVWNWNARASAILDRLDQGLKEVRRRQPAPDLKSTWACFPSNVIARTPAKPRNGAGDLLAETRRRG